MESFNPRFLTKSRRRAHRKIQRYISLTVKWMPGSKRFSLLPVEEVSPMLYTIDEFIIQLESYEPFITFRDVLVQHSEFTYGIESVFLVVLPHFATFMSPVWNYLEMINKNIFFPQYCGNPRQKETWAKLIDALNAKTACVFYMPENAILWAYFDSYDLDVEDVGILKCALVKIQEELSFSSMHSMKSFFMAYDILHRSCGFMSVNSFITLLIELSIAPLLCAEELDVLMKKYLKWNSLICHAEFDYDLSHVIVLDHTDHISPFCPNYQMIIIPFSEDEELRERPLYTLNQIWGENLRPLSNHILESIKMIRDCASTWRMIYHFHVTSKYPMSKTNFVTHLLAVMIRCSNPMLKSDLFKLAEFYVGSHGLVEWKNFLTDFYYTCPTNFISTLNPDYCLLDNFPLLATCDYVLTKCKQMCPLQRKILIEAFRTDDTTLRGFVSSKNAAIVFKSLLELENFEITAIINCYQIEIDFFYLAFFNDLNERSKQVCYEGLMFMKKNLIGNRRLPRTIIEANYIMLRIKARNILKENKLDDRLEYYVSLCDGQINEVIFEKVLTIADPALTRRELRYILERFSRKEKNGIIIDHELFRYLLKELTFRTVDFGPIKIPLKVSEDFKIERPVKRIHIGGIIDKIWKEESIKWEDIPFSVKDKGETGHIRPKYFKQIMLKAKMVTKCLSEEEIDKLGLYFSEPFDGVYMVDYILFVHIMSTLRWHYIYGNQH